jgi:hypothetical protein
MCHSCGARGNLPQLVYEITGDHSAIASIYSFIINNGLERLQNGPIIPKPSTVDWETYIAFDQPPDEQLASRHLSRESAERYGLLWNHKKGSWIIPIMSETNELVGWQEKSQDYVRNYPIGVKKSQTLFGADALATRDAILVESPLDVVRYASEFQHDCCVASYGASLSNEQIKMLSHLCDSLTIALDNDEAGISSAKKLLKKFPTMKKGIKWLKYSHTLAKDIGEMTKEEIQEAVNNASVLPWWL